MNENKEKIISAFKEKILGICNYSGQEFFVNDFKNLDILNNFLGEVFCGESDITPAGKAFLHHYYGLENLVSILFKESKSIASSEFGMESEKSIFEWLENLVPMEIMTFIEKARGNIQDGDTLRPDLLPPENFN